MKPVILGIDTSCYTSSLALMDRNGNLLAEHRQLLSVPQGERGLRQSMAVFQHLHNLPQLLADTVAEKNWPPEMIIASSRPRPVRGSYMPVFVVGEKWGQSLAQALGTVFLATSHQEGHLMAGLWSAGVSLPARFLAVHLSGGTSELLLVDAKQQEAGFEIKVLGATTDLHAGQLIDRVGVRIGLNFPAGPELETLAAQSGANVLLPSAVRGFDFSFSGAETRARRLLDQGAAPADVARATEACIAKTLEKVLRRAVQQYQVPDVMLVGGVAANSYLRERLTERLTHPAVGARLVFARARYSTDNAAGVAAIGRQEVLLNL